MEVFNPHIADPDYSLRSRIQGKSIALVNFGNRYVTVMQACYDKSWKFGVAHTYPTNDPQIEKQLIECSPGKLLAITYGDRVSITTEAARTTTGHHIRSEQQDHAILAKFNESSLTSLQKKYKEKGFCILRIQITCLNLLNCMLAEPMPGNSTIIVMDQEYMIGVKIHNGSWSTVRSVLVDSKEDHISQALKDLTSNETELIRYWDTKPNDERFQIIAKGHHFDQKSEIWVPANAATFQPELELLTYA